MSRITVPATAVLLAAIATLGSLSGISRIAKAERSVAIQRAELPAVEVRATAPRSPEGGIAATDAAGQPL